MLGVPLFTPLDNVPVSGDFNFPEGKPGGIDADGDLAFEVVKRCWEKGVLMFNPVGFGGATVKICPPLVITEEAIDESCAVLESAFAEAVG